MYIYELSFNTLIINGTKNKKKNSRRIYPAHFIAEV